MATVGTGPQFKLRDWLGIFHPAYRTYLAVLLGIGIVSGVLTFLNLVVLQSLVQTFAAIGQLDQVGCRDAGEINLLTEFVVCSGLATGWAVALLVLLAYAGLELLQAALRILRLFIEGHLEIKSQNDIEREVLVNLMRKDDQFFQRQSATEIANRLSEDTSRMFERRHDISELWSVSVQAIGALAFLWSQHWTYAAAVLVFSLAGVYVIHRMLGPMKELDRQQLQSDDNVKAAFEDYLHAAPEAQMGNLSRKIAGQLAVIQGHRQAAFMGLVNLNSKLSATYSLTQLIAFGSIMCAIVYAVIMHGLTLADGFVAAVVRAVPQLYGNISEIAKLYMKFQLADVSAKRLMEYETDSNIGNGSITTDLLEGRALAPIELNKVRYTFAPGGPIQGGPDGITLTIPPKTLNVVVGPSGSGKSMLSQLVMGRLKPVSGSIRFGERDISSEDQLERSTVFSYMPQSLAIITGNIRENIEFGLADKAWSTEGALNDAVFAWIDRTKVGQFTREKALDLPPEGPATQALEDKLQSLRKELRIQVAKEVGVKLISLAARPLVPHFSILEHITHSAALSERVVRLAFSREGFRVMDRLSVLQPGREIMEFGSHVISQTQHILTRCASYDAYIELAPYGISPAVWALRSDFAREQDIDLDDVSNHGELILLGLTATPQEADSDCARAFAEAIARIDLAAFADVTVEHFRAALEPLEEGRFNRNMCWRDNLLFGTPETINTPTARAVDRVLIRAVANTALDRELLNSGLQYQVGRQGKRLSGGQRQLVSLCRTFLQGSPVLVLDEPTAALDPMHRAAVNALLRDVAGQHTVIVITHDADLARLADEVLMMKDGQLWANGTFDVLARDNVAFRTMANFNEATSG